MSEMKKCFRCGMLDLDGVFVCRAHGHIIDKPLEETCDDVIMVDEVAKDCEELVWKKVELNEAGTDLVNENIELRKRNAELKELLREAHVSLINYRDILIERSLYPEFKKLLNGNR